MMVRGCLALPPAPSPLPRWPPPLPGWPAPLPPLIQTPLPGWPIPLPPLCLFGIFSKLCTLNLLL